MTAYPAPPHALERTPARWTPARKEEVVIALHRGVITRPDALARFGLTEAELASWEARFARHGRRGLATHTLQETRP